MRAALMCDKKTANFLPLSSLCIRSEIFPLAAEYFPFKSPSLKSAVGCSLFGFYQCFSLIISSEYPDLFAPCSGFASLGGCGRMLSCHLPAFKALRVGSPGGSDALSLRQSHRFSALHRHSSPPPSSSFTLLLSSDDFCIQAAEVTGAADFVLEEISL